MCGANGEMIEGSKFQPTPLPVPGLEAPSAALAVAPDEAPQQPSWLGGVGGGIFQGPAGGGGVHPVRERERERERGRGRDRESERRPLVVYGLCGKLNLVLLHSTYPCRYEEQ